MQATVGVQPDSLASVAYTALSSASAVSVPAGDGASVSTIAALSSGAD